MRTNFVLIGASLARLVQCTLDPFMIEALTSIIPTEVLAAGVATLFTSTVINNSGGKTDILKPLTLMGGGLSSPLPRRTELPARFAKEMPGSRSVKMRYGPYTVPGMYLPNGFMEGGSLWNYPDISVTKPCEKCVIFGMNAGLEYMDGSNANIDTEVWLHHMVLFNVGWGRIDQTCAGATIEALPHANVGCTPWMCERLFASGNERTPAFMIDTDDQTNQTKPVGYHVDSNDRFAVIIDLMNDSSAAKTVFLTMYYDFLDGWPEGVDHMRPVWLDVDQCGISDVRAPKQSGSFKVPSKPWTATMDGEILGYGGHLHDGGTVIDVFVDDVPDCSSSAIYGATKEFNNSMSSMDSMESKSATSHISNMTLCNKRTTLKTQQMKKGQKWTLDAKYDYNEHKGKLDEWGWQEPVMGIVIMYVRQPWDAKKVKKRMRGTGPMGLAASIS